MLDRRTFEGGIDTDSDKLAIAPGDYIGAADMSNSPLIQGGALSALRGSNGLDYNFPAGTNKFVGSINDLNSGRTILFVHNTSGNHQIAVIEGVDTPIIVAYGAHLGFTPDTRIHGELIDGDIIIFTDAIPENNLVTGQGVKSLSISRSRLDKYLAWDFIFGVPDGTQFLAGQTFVFDVKNPLGIVQATATIVSDGTYDTDFRGGMKWLAEEITLILSGFVNAEACDCHIRINAEDVDLHLFLTTTEDAIIVPQNHYAAPYNFGISDQITLARPCPLMAPNVAYTSDATTQLNNVRDLCPQFRVRYKYWDNTVSPWSPISVVPINMEQDSLNAINIDFTDERLSNPRYLAIISSVEVAFRDQLDNPFRLITNIQQCDLGITSQRILFRNDSHYNVIESDDLSTATSEQVLANDHMVPRVAASVCHISDDQGNSRVALGGLLEGYNCPECTDVVLESTVSDNPEYVTITGRVDIQNIPALSGENPDFHDMALDGFVVYLAGTRLFGISNNPADGSGDGSFTINNVPKGKYSIRVAHYLCRWDNTYGERHNLNNGIEWQRTSAPCISVCGGTPLPGSKTIDLTAFAGTTFDLITESGFGPIVIQNAHATAAFATPDNYLAEVYTKNNEGQHNTAALRTGAEEVPVQNISFYQFNKGTAEYGLISTKASDHNGYAFAYIELTASTHVCRVYLEGIEDVVPASPPTGNTPPTPQMWLGHFGQIENDTATAVYTGFTGYTNLWNAFVYDDLSKPDYPGFAIAHIYNGDTSWTPTRRCKLSGVVKNSDGAPVSNALVWMVGHGMTFTTGASGTWELNVYGLQDGLSSATYQYIYCTIPGDVPGDYPVPRYEPGVGGIDYHFGGLPDTTPVVIPDFVVPYAGYLGSEIRNYKSGGRYGVGIVYFDSRLRGCGVIPLDTITLDYHTEDGIYSPRSIKYTLRHKPPSWAVKYAFVRTKDGLYQDYSVLPAEDIIYGKISSDFLEMDDVGYASGIATHILIQSPVPETNSPVSNPTLVIFDENTQDGYRAKLGDRCRALLDNNQDPVAISGIIDMNVVGEYVNGDKYYVVVENPMVSIEFLDGFYFELYSPRSIDDRIYYECGQPLDIIGPGASSASHSGSIQNQDVLFNVPAIGLVDGGDVWWRNSNVSYKAGMSYSFLAEHKKMRDSDDLYCEDLGRPHIYDPYAREIFRYNMIRVSGLYIPNSGINDTTLFGSTDYININRAYGPINWLGMVGDTLLVIGEQDAQPIYVGRDQIMDLSGGNSVGRSTKLLNMANSTSSRSGTMDPLSVARFDDKAIWWDQKNGIFWRYGQDGVNSIVGKCTNKFLSIARAREAIAQKHRPVVAGIDNVYGHYFATFRPSTDGRTPYSGQSVIFGLHNYRHISDFQAIPEVYGSRNRNFYIMSGISGLHKMYFNPNSFCRWFNVNYTPSVTVLFNGEPSTVKQPQNLRVKCGFACYSSQVLTSPGLDYPVGMASTIPVAHWQYREGTSWAFFLRDKDDPHIEFTSIIDPIERAAKATLSGRYLKGHWVQVKLDFIDAQKQNYVIFADINFTPSNTTR